MISSRKLAYMLITLILCMCFLSCTAYESSWDIEYKEEIKGLPDFNKEGGILVVDGVKYVRSNWQTSLTKEEAPFGIVNDSDSVYFKTKLYYYNDDTHHDFIEYYYEFDYGSGFVRDTFVKEDISQSMDFINGYEVEVIGYKLKEGETAIWAVNQRIEASTIIKGTDALDEITSVINQKNSTDINYKERKNVVGCIVLQNNNYVNGCWKAKLIEYKGNIYVEVKVMDTYQYKPFPKESILAEVLYDLRK